MQFIYAKKTPLTEGDIGTRCVFLFEGWPHPVVGVVSSITPKGLLVYRVDGAFESFKVVEENGPTGDRLHAYAPFKIPQI